MKHWIEIAKPPNPKLDAKDQNQICLVGTKIEMANCKWQKQNHVPNHGATNESTEGSKRGSCSSNASNSSWMTITELDNKQSKPKLRSNQKVGRNKWSSTKKRQKLSSTSNETANQNLRENQASNSSNDTHERIPHKTQDLNSVQVNLCQKHLFSRQLIHNMTKDCSLIYQFST